MDFNELPNPDVEQENLNKICQLLVGSPSKQLENLINSDASSKQAFLHINCGKLCHTHGENYWRHELLEAQAVRYPSLMGTFEANTYLHDKEQPDGC